MRLSKKEELKVRQRLEQICSGLVSDGWEFISGYCQNYDPVFGFNAFRLFTHKRGGSLAVKVEQTRIEIWRNGKLRHEEIVHAK